MALLRSAAQPVGRVDVLAAAANGGVRDAQQPVRALESLIADGLAMELDGRIRLPE